MLFQLIPHFLFQVMRDKTPLEHGDLALVPCIHPTIISPCRSNSVRFEWRPIAVQLRNVVDARVQLVQVTDATNLPLLCRLRI